MKVKCIKSLKFDDEYFEVGKINEKYNPNPIKKIEKVFNDNYSITFKNNDCIELENISNGILTYYEEKDYSFEKVLLIFFLFVTILSILNFLKKL